jgi:Protein of unknown function (DUF2738)
MPVALTAFQEFNTDHIHFSDPYTIYPHDESYSAYHKIYIQVGDHPQRLNDLILNTPPHLMSFGIQEKKDRSTSEVSGYQIPIILWNKKGATEDEKNFTNTLQSIVGKCQDHINQHYDADPSKLSLLSWRNQENGEEYPVIYVKLITNRKTNRIMTLFINEDTNEEIDPMELINKRCLLTAAIKIENMYVGDNVSLQIKLYEVLVKFIDKKKRNYYKPQSLLRPKSFIPKKPSGGRGSGAAAGGEGVQTAVNAAPSPATASNNIYEVLEAETDDIVEAETDDIVEAEAENA